MRMAVLPVSITTPLLIIIFLILVPRPPRDRFLRDSADRCCPSHPRDFLHGPPTRAGTSGSGRWVVRRPETMEDTMSSTIQITFDARDPRALSQFWRDEIGRAHV